jgi:hypothetical protein
MQEYKCYRSQLKAYRASGRRPQNIETLRGPMFWGRRRRARCPQNTKPHRGARLELAGRVSKSKRRRIPRQCKPLVSYRIPCSTQLSDLSYTCLGRPKTTNSIMCLVMEQSGSRPLPTHDQADHRHCTVDELLAKFSMLRLED